MTLPKEKLKVQSGKWKVRLNSQLSTLNSQLRKGFTLIELLTVIAIIGMLLAAATASFTQSQKKGRDGKRKADLKSIQQALELYYQVNGRYPPIPPGGSTDNYCTQIVNPTYTAIKTALEPTYINPLPKDPRNPDSASDYQYKQMRGTSPFTEGYELHARLEITNDPEANQSINTCATFPGSTCTNPCYNYKVKNP